MYLFCMFKRNGEQNVCGFGTFAFEFQRHIYHFSLFLFLSLPLAVERVRAIIANTSVSGCRYAPVYSSHFCDVWRAIWSTFKFYPLNKSAQRCEHRKKKRNCCTYRLAYMPILFCVDVPSYNKFFVVIRVVVFLWFSYSNTLAGVVYCKVNTSKAELNPLIGWFIHCHLNCLLHIKHGESFSLRAMQCFYFHCFYLNSNTSYATVATNVFSFKPTIDTVEQQQKQQQNQPDIHFNHEFRSNALHLFILKHHLFLVTQFQFFRFGFIAQLHACFDIFYYVDVFLFLLVLLFLRFADHHMFSDWKNWIFYTLA